MSVMNKAPGRDNLNQSMHRTMMHPAGQVPPVQWQVSKGLTAYEDALERMEKIADGIASGSEPERVWLLEHPPLYTAGTSARPGDLVTPDRFAVYKTGRGGEYTYHGPGQRVCYVMLDLSRRSQDVRAYVATLEAWIINTLAHFNVKAERREDRVGVWVKQPDKPPLGDSTPREDKIAAIGIRLRRWVSFHGISINLEPELEHYSGIVPCGVSDHGITSLADLDLPVTMADLDQALKQEFERLFGETIAAK